MLSRSEVHALQRSLTPEFKTIQSGNSGSTEMVLLSDPSKVYAVGFTNIGAPKNIRIADGADTAANRRFFVGPLAASEEFFITFSPSFVRFQTAFRVIVTVADEIQWTIYYTEDV